MPTAQQQKTTLPWETTEDITWKIEADKLLRAESGDITLAQAAAGVYEDFTPDRQIRHLTEDLLPASEVVRRTKRKPIHLEEQIAVIARAIQHEIVGKRKPSNVVQLNLRLSPEEKEFIEALLKLRGYECEWDHDAPKLDFTEDHADSNGRHDHILHAWVPASAWLD